MNIIKKRLEGDFLSRLMDEKSWAIKNSGSVLAFETAGGGHWEAWDRYLTIEGKKTFHIGNICGTCEFFFERLEGASQGVSPGEVSSTLEEGVSQLDDDLLSKVSSILPDGDYTVSLMEVNPRLVAPGTEEDYFIDEQIRVWGIDSFWGLPHHPKTKYYRGETKALSHQSKLFEFIVPTFPVHWLDNETVEKYKSLISAGGRPTALCLSVLDIKEPSDARHDPAHPEHWCLTHYIVDGHHKVFSAAQVNQPVTILSFLAKIECIAGEEDFKTLLKNL